MDRDILCGLGADEILCGLGGDILVRAIGGIALSSFFIYFFEKLYPIVSDVEPVLL
jgi:hypothetical protein